MDISMNIDRLLLNDLTVNEYLYLRNLYVGKDDKIKDLYKLISHINEDSLQERNFIKITDEAIVLRSRTIDLFDNKSLFFKFLATFPIKTPSGRYLSPAGTEGIAVDKLKKKWDSLFKNKENLQCKAIAVLEAELKWRKQSNQLEYIHASETWLNSADFEKYEYLINDQSNALKKDKWM